MKLDSTQPDDVVDILFRDALRQELSTAVPTQNAFKKYHPIAVPERQIRGGGPGGQRYSGFYLLYYVLNSSRPSLGTILG